MLALCWLCFYSQLNLEVLVTFLCSAKKYILVVSASNLLWRSALHPIHKAVMVPFYGGIVSLVSRVCYKGILHFVLPKCVQHLIHTPKHVIELSMLFHRSIYFRYWLVCELVTTDMGIKYSLVDPSCGELMIHKSQICTFCLLCGFTFNSRVALFA